MSNFLKHFGVGALAAIVGGLAAYFGAPEHYAALGAFAGVVATIGSYVRDVLQKLADKLKGA
jgi:hypothetical protein